MPIKTKCDLRGMGPEKYQKTIERLMMPGVLAATIAKEITKEFPGMPIPLLAQKLRRARAAAEAASARLKLEQAIIKRASRVSKIFIIHRCKSSQT
jgi:hypothetical protein